ncbi:hypothetical protein HAX54_036694 [Datura stramonium]|uniref:Uncharacterized protein n=1 Tax=Datura stramonium TaxID=4076 RepID=A0ABS8Y970_DATST|nr:hypothetical protein [Datura stramonium]
MVVGKTGARTRTNRGTKEPYVRLPPHMALSRASVVGLGIKPLSMHVFSACTDESFASRVVSNNGACVAGDARP